MGTVQTKGSWEVIPKERDVLVSLHYRASETSTKTADNALGSTSPVNKCLPSQNIPHTLAGPAANMNSFKVNLSDNPTMAEWIIVKISKMANTIIFRIKFV